MLLGIPAVANKKMDQFSNEEIDSYALDVYSSLDIPVSVTAMEQFTNEQIDHFLSTSGDWTQDDWNLLRTAVPDDPSPYMLEGMSGDVHDLMEDVAEHVVEPGAVQSSNNEPINTAHTQPSQQQNSIDSNDRSTAVRMRRRYNVGEWEEKRDLIRTLYIDQEKSLKAMRQILQEEHGFDASEKAYKDKIREWGLRKNLNQRQVVFMLKMAKKRRVEEGKDTTFFYRGNQVSDTKIRRYSKAIDTSSDVGSVPSNITYVTPNHSISSKLRPQGIEKSQQIESEEGLAPTKSEHESLRSTTNELFQLFQFDFEGPRGLFAPHFRVLDNRLKDISSQQLRDWIDLSEDQQNATIDSISNVFQDFTKACLNTAGTAHLNRLLSHHLALPSMLREIRQIMIRNVIWQYPNRVFLPVLQFHAQCAIASGSYDQAEVVIDRLLAEQERFYRANIHKASRQQYIQKAIPTILLLGKAYLAQKKFYLLERLLRTLLSDVENIQGVDKEMLAIHKIQFLVYTLVLATDHGTYPLYNHDYQSMAVSLVPRLLDIQLGNDNQEVEILWAIGLMEILRNHYAGYPSEEAKLVSLLERMRLVVKKAIMHTTTWEGQAHCLIVHAVNGLQQPYGRLGMHNEKLEWRFVSRTWGLNTLASSCDMTAQEQTEQTQIAYAMHLMGPLFTDFLGQWPSIALPSIPRGGDPIVDIWLD